MQIRRYQPGEEAEIRAVLYGSLRNVVARDYTPEQIERWTPDDYDREAWKQKVARTNPFVAVVDGRLAGFAELEPDGHIDCFYCHHEFQRCGVGRALLAAVEEEAARLGLSSLFAEVSVTAIAFFLAQGFVIEEERSNLVCNAPARQFMTRKILEHRSP